MRVLAASSIAAVAAFLATHAGSAPAPDADAALRALARAEAGTEAKIVRIGLDAAHSLRVAASGELRIVDAQSGAAVWKERYSGEMAIVADGGPEGETQAIYRIQIAAFSRREAAEAEKDRLEKAFAAPGTVHYVPDRGSWRVRLGEAGSREALGPLLDRLRAAGLPGIWITEEAKEAAAGVRLRLVDSSYDSRALAQSRIVVLAPSGGFVKVEGKPYRGVIELRLTRAGLVRAVDWIDLESYLLGVVPAELGPEIWPQIEALKAQAVAARTYTWKNLGQFADEGFDLCATPRCQVYAGVAAEHPLSDRAVVATRAEILTWEGRPVSALYTATCGGHTEDAEQIFPEERAPYLRGVPCRAEEKALASLRRVLPGAETKPVLAETGEDATRAWALLVAAGVVDPAADASAKLSSADLRAWTQALARLAGRPWAEPPRGDVLDLGAAAEALVAATGWAERARILLTEEDLPALVRDPAARDRPASERLALAYLALTGAIEAFPDGRFGVDLPPSRARLLKALARIGDAYEAFGLAEATVTSLAPGLLGLARGKGSLELPVAPLPYLFALAGERAVPSSRLELWPGDRVRYRTNPDGKIDFLELRPPVKGVTDDRSAKVYSWEVRQTREEVEEAVNRRVDVGRLADLRVLKRGVSGRIVELQVQGDKGSSIVRGFDVRSLLGLRESLTVIEPQRGPDGKLEAVVFAGKGWGHGVGLCQVGAYGMALRGVGYRDILAHYYRGAALARAPDDER